jgi:hypothetical protein
MQTIGYFGDSFCESPRHDSWCVLLAQKLDCEITHFGRGGASIWHTFMEYEKLQFKNQLPDYMVFCWTEPYRLYHKDLPIAKGAVPIAGKDPNIYRAADMYYVYLQDYRKEELAYTYALQWFDRHILSQKSNAHSILQTWSMRPFELGGTSVDLELTSGTFVNESMLEFAWGGKTPKEGFKFDINLANHFTVEQNKTWAEKMYSNIEKR